MKILKFVLIIALGGFLLSSYSSGKDWRTANRDSAGIAPDPLITPEAIVQVYGAKAYSWRGWFAIHTWIAAKRTGEGSYTVYDVVGWRGHHGSGQPVMQVAQGIPDRYWFGAKPSIIQQHRGPGVDELIEAIDKAAASYPWKTSYKVFPGPNSNTFTAWIAKMVPELEVALPITAIGKGYVN